MFYLGARFGICLQVLLWGALGGVASSDEDAVPRPASSPAKTGPQWCGSVLETDDAALGGPGSVSMLQRSLKGTKATRAAAAAKVSKQAAGGERKESAAGNGKTADGAASGAAAQVKAAADAALSSASSAASALLAYVVDVGKAVSGESVGHHGQSTGESGATATAFRAWEEHKKPGSSFLYVLPVLGFAVVLAAIWFMILVEQGWPQSTLPGQNVKDAMEFGGLELALAGVAAPPQSRWFSGRRASPFKKGAGAVDRFVTHRAAVPSALQQQQLPHNPQRYGRAPLSPSVPWPPIIEKPPPKVPVNGASGGAPNGWAPLAAKGPGEEVQILVAQLPGGNVMGVNLSDTDLTVTGFASEAARALGFVLGDQVLAINGVRVASEEEFRVAMRRAVDLLAAGSAPIMFTVFRPEERSLHPDAMKLREEGLRRQPEPERMPA